MNMVIEHANNLMGEALGRKNVANDLDGAGEYVNITRRLEDAEIDTNVAHSGQGDFAEYVVNPEDNVENVEARRSNDMNIFGVRLAVIAMLHPIEYGKVLIQLGHEPIPAQVSQTMFGQSVKMWPNLFKYIGHIRSVDGLYGCYRGLTPKLCGSIVSVVGGKKLVDFLGLAPDKGNNVNCESYEQFIITLKRDVVLTASGLILSHPFHVISLRMMAQFIGRETAYTTIFGSFAEIYRNEGLVGFFAGLIPKLLCNVSCVILTSSVTYIANKYYIKDKLLRQYNGGVLQYLFSSVLYPFQVISTCMAVTGSGLKAGQPPIMPVYKNWIDCWIDLEARGEQKRGASMFWRSIPIPLKRESIQQKLLSIPQKE